MAHVIRRPAIFVSKVVWIGGESPSPVSIALRFGQSIIDIETHVSIKPAAKRDDELILIEAAGRVVLKIIVCAERSRATSRRQRIESPRQRRVDGAGPQEMQGARMTVGYAGCKVVRQRSLNADRCLHGIWGSDIFFQSIDCDGRGKRRQGSDRWHVGKRIQNRWIGNDELLLINSIQAVRGQR